MGWDPPELPFGYSVYGYRLRWKGPGQSYSDTERWAATSGLSYRVEGLDNGVRYFVQVAAGIVGEGFSSWSEVSGVPRTEPGAPRSVRADPGDEMLTVRWQAPVDDGGSAVTGYRVQWLIGGGLAGEETASGLSHEIDGLANEVEYGVRVAAVNEAGVGAWSEEAAGTPVGPPGPPRGLGVERGDRSAVLEWLEPGDDGGSDITGYRVQWRTGGQSFSTSSRQRLVAADERGHEIAGLANGTEYFVRVLAVNGLGDGDTPVEVPVTPATTPGPPGGVRAVRGDRSITVSWRAPGDDGGSDVTGYVVEWSDDDFARTTGRWPVAADVAEYVIEGLVNGTEYSLRVLAVNDVGEGGAATAAPVTPATSPGAPVDVGAARGDGFVTVSWGAPDDGGSDVAGYTVQWRADDDQFVDTDPTVPVSGTALSRQVGGLTNGTEYFARVRATNDVDAGPWSSPASATPARVAAPPRSVGVEAVSMSVTVTWSLPSDDGGSAIAGYKVQWRAESDGHSPAREAVKGQNDRSHQIGGLVNGTKHYVRVLAVNNVGDGAASAEVSATPATIPQAPGSVDAERGDRLLEVSWEPPDDGGSAITQYRVQWSTDDQFDSSDPSATASGTAVGRRIASLTNGTEYWVRVRATNDVDDGPWSSAVSEVPATAPGAPGSVSVERGDRSIMVGWAPPGYDGGLDVTGYIVEWSDDQFDQDLDALPLGAAAVEHLIEGLANGTRYWARVRAVSDAGEGAVSSPQSAVPATVPGPPAMVELEVLDRALDVSWQAPDDGGSAITQYRVQWSTDDQFDSTDPTATANGTAVSRRIGSLTNGTRYWVRVLAHNSVDDGPWSSAVSAVPATPPSVPRSVTAEPGDRSLDVSWMAPADDGDSAVTGYLVQWRADGEAFATDRQATVTGTAHPISGLVNGTEHWVQVQAVNGAGTGPAAGASGVPRTVPGALDAPVIHSNAGTLLVSWEPPDDDGGSDVTGYRVQWKGPGQSYNETDRLATPTSPSHQITGLDNGTQYTVRIAAVNDAGTGPAVEETAVVADPPGAPTSTVVRVRNRSLYVTWSSPDTIGGSAITEYRVLWKGPNDLFDDSFCSDRRFIVSANSSNAVAGPLTNGTSYDVRVVAVNDSGPGEPSDSSGIPAAIPGGPHAVGAFAVDGGLLAEWEAPWDAGSPITQYEVQWRGPGQQYSADRQAVVTDMLNLSHEITGLTNGAQYDLRVNATNANGTGRNSSASGRPADAPGRPTAMMVTPRKPDDEDFRGGGRIPFTFTITWEPPADIGGSEITGYQVNWRRSWSETYNEGFVLTDLTDLSFEIVRWCHGSNGCTGRLYYFRVSAINADGTGPAARGVGAVVHWERDSE